MSSAKTGYVVAPAQPRTGAPASKPREGISPGWSHSSLPIAVLNALPAAAYACDDQGRLTYFNAAAALLWGRSPEKTRQFAEQMSRELDRTITVVPDTEEATRRADVICTVTSSREPIIFGDWVKPGTHINLVGSSLLGPVEVDTALVAGARYIADYRLGALAQGAELAAARDAGLVDDTHVVGEIGEVLAGRVPGRQDNSQITIYKSLGHVAQDLASAAYLQKRAKA